jgi:hypothetical protein
MEEPCELCGRIRKLTFHHLIPKTLHSNKWFEKNFAKEDMRTRGLQVCKDCHSAIHRFIPEKELGRSYNTKEKLMAHDELSAFIQWVSKR